MAVLSKEDYFSRMNEIVGTDTSDSTLSFIEDMTDTYNDLEQRANGDGENWEKKYNDLNESWKKKYRARFFSSGGNVGHGPEEEETEGKDPNKTKVEDLFTPIKK